MSGKLEFNLRSCLKDVSDSLLFIRRFAEEAGLSERQSYVLNLAYEELATNIVKYGFDDSSGHWIKVLLENNAKGVFLTLMDDGREFDPRSVSAPDLSMNLETREIGGVGLHLVKEMACSIAYSRENGWNIVKVQI